MGRPPTDRAISRRADTTWVNSAIGMAANTCPFTPETIVHADHGPQFTAWEFTTNLRAYGLRLSMGNVGDCYANAPIESFWGRMQIELLNTNTWTTGEELSIAIAYYIENFHNTRRRHSVLDMFTPTESEILNTPQLHHALARTKNRGQISSKALTPSCRPVSKIMLMHPV
jgi:transposase InsO family protein